jgi:transposase InsO family protein
VKLPAVSGSSGRLIVERLKDDQERQYPGRVFEDQSLDYAEAMQAFMAASAQAKKPVEQPEDPEQTSTQVSIRRLRQAEERLRIERRNTRDQRCQEDAAWKTLRQQHRQEQVGISHQRVRYGERKAWKANWQALRQHRRQIMEQRQQEDEVWRKKRQILRTQLAELPVVTTWIAILVMTDNCTRQCLGLPLFVAGANVTSEMIISALRTLLPAELQFVISDRGVHFTAQAFKDLARSKAFIHIEIARHRPQSNGIAERFVRTLKEWLATQSWKTDQELLDLLSQFRSEYNDRPHQGLAIPGLSPNEFANRIWLM